MNRKKCNKPEVSIIVVVNTSASPDTIFRLLDSFYPQHGNIVYEFIVVEEENEQRAKIYSEHFPWVNLIQIKERTPGSHERNVALQIAKGDIIVFMQDHITVEKDYLQNLKKCFLNDCDAVGGPVINGCTEKLSNWVLYFCEYHKWTVNIREGEIDDLPGCNFAYRSDSLKELGFFIEGNFKLEFLFNEKARQKGKHLYFFRGLKVKHFADKDIFDLWSYRFRYGRVFASKRGFPGWKRISYAALFPLVAAVEYVRIFRNIRGDRICLKKFIESSPLLLLTLFIWMFGECFGYLFGSNISQKQGTACQRT